MFSETREEIQNGSEIIQTPESMHFIEFNFEKIKTPTIHRNYSILYQDDETLYSC